MRSRCSSGTSPPDPGRLILAASRLILASRSPQRRAILEQIGVPFTVVPADVDELENAYRKAAKVAAAGDTGSPPVLGVDTVVSLGSTIFGQPRDSDHAARMLEALGGREHRVLSGLCVIDGERVTRAAAVTSVAFAPLTPARLEWYLTTGEWRGRAGGYAIQGAGAVLVEAVHGDYLNVVGLPVTTLLDLLPSLI